MRCQVCKKPLNDRTDVRYEMDGKIFCGHGCIFKYRGERRLV